MSSARFVTALSPWLLFAVLVGRDSDHRVAIAAVVALAVAVGLAVHSAVVRRRLTSLDMAGVVTFAALTLVAVPPDGGGRTWVADHGLAVATLVLAVAMLASVVTVPFTARARPRRGAAAVLDLSCLPVPARAVECHLGCCGLARDGGPLPRI